MTVERWNHNLHYHSVLLEALPADAQRALDVGCGEGTLTRELQADEVVGSDLDPPSIELARETSGPDIAYVLGDVLTHPFEPESFDAVVSVATLHHVDARAGLIRMRELLAPGGTLALLGLARSQLPRDLPREVVAAAVNRVHMARRTYWEHSAPMVWPPPETYAGMRRIVAGVLPGARFRRHLLWRYSLVWTKPAA
jgi:SAM-dependent methyltransferase